MIAKYKLRFTIKVIKMNEYVIIMQYSMLNNS